MHATAKSDRLIPTHYYLFAVSAIVLVCWFVYLNSLTTPFQFDDFENIQNNAAVHQGLNLKQIWNSHRLRFFTYLTFALNWQAGETATWGYHLVNITVHMMNGVLCFWLALLFLGTPKLKEKWSAQAGFAVALSAAAIFTVHPLQTEAVTYVVQRATSLCTLFYLSALCFYVCFLGSPRKRWYTMAVLSALAATFSKQIAISIPFAILLTEWVGFGFHGTNLKKIAKRLLPFLLIAGIIPALVLIYGSAEFAGTGGFFAQSNAISRTSYFLTQSHVILTYLRLLIWPVHQNVDYDYPFSNDLFEPVTLISLSACAILLMSAWFLTRKKRVLGFALFWFLLTLAPESSFYPIDDVIFEHRLYLPMFGFALFASATLYRIVRNWKMFALISFISIAILGNLTIVRNRIWSDRLGLWLDTAQKSPAKVRVLNNVAREYLRRKDYDDAVKWFRKALALDPTYAFTYAKLCQTYGEQNFFDQALEACQQALELNPDDADIYNSLGIIEIAKREFEKARQNLKHALRLKPNFYQAMTNLGLVYEKTGNLNKARKWYLQAIDINPKSPVAYHNLGITFAKEGNFKQAIDLSEQAVRLNPNYLDAHRALSTYYKTLGDKANFQKENQILHWIVEQRAGRK